jgi:adenylylsulfate kinase-like enzyme
LKEDAKHLYDQAKSGELSDKAKVKLEELKEDAKHLYDQAKSGELTDKAKVKA